MNYIGSKHSIVKFIENTINEFCKLDKDDIVFCDIFSGTGTVGKNFKKKGYSIISNDIQSYSYITAKHFIENIDEIKFEILKENGIYDVFNYLNEIKGEENFIFKNYSIGGTKGSQYERMYFSDENAKKIDSIRLVIENWKRNNKITDKEYYYLIASLIESSDKVANTASVYEAFLKKLKLSAQKPLVLLPVETISGDKDKLYDVYNEDANTLINEIKGDILYMDPPYNNRKYDTNYHILETIALYDTPEIKGKTGIRKETIKKSKYCLKKEASNALEELIKKAKFKYLILSYNDEGIISFDEIKNIMTKYGKYKCYHQKHKRFKADNKRNYSKDYTIEYLHCLEKNIDKKSNNV